MRDGILYCLSQNLSMCFRVQSRDPVTFKTKVSGTTVNNSFLPLPIFSHKELHLNVAAKYENFNGYWGTPIIECSTGKISKTDSPRCPKNTFSEVFALSFLHLMSNGLNGVDISWLM